MAPICSVARRHGNAQLARIEHPKRQRGVALRTVVAGITHVQKRDAQVFRVDDLAIELAASRRVRSAVNMSSSHFLARIGSNTRSCQTTCARLAVCAPPSATSPMSGASTDDR